MNLQQNQQYAIKVNGNVTGIFGTPEEANYKLALLRQSEPHLYEHASVVIIDNSSRELLLG